VSRIRILPEAVANKIAAGEVLGVGVGASAPTLSKAVRGALAPEELFMGRLRHRTGEGWTYFVTTKSWESTFWFQVTEAAEIVVGKMLEYRDQGNYLLHDFVLMPNHLHLILTPSSASLEKCMQLIKGGSSFEIHKLRGKGSEIWQSGFHESRVKSWSDYEKKRDYVIFNPVAAKLVERPELWPYGSACDQFRLDPIPQGLKPHPADSPYVGPKGPTPNGSSRAANS
jgi:putative transposase